MAVTVASSRMAQCGGDAHTVAQPHGPVLGDAHTVAQPWSPELSAPRKPGLSAR